MSSTLSRLAYSVNPSGRRDGNLFAPRTLIADLFSFEAVFLLFLYSNSFQVVLPPLPVDLTYLFLGLSLAVGGYVVMREGLYFRGLIVVAAFLPYLIWLLLSAEWSPSRGLKYEYLKIMFTANLWCLIAGAMIVAHKRERMQRFLKIMVGLSLVVAVMGSYIYLAYGSFKFAGWEGFGRVYNNWGRAVANGAVVLLILFLRSRLGTTRQLATGALLAVCVFFIFVASSRSALLSMAAPCLLLFAVTFVPVGREGLSISRTPVLLLLAVTVVVVVVSALMASGYRIDTLARLQRVFEQADNTELVQGPNRWVYYGFALQLITESPIVGHGVRSFSILFKRFEDPGAHPHNIFLEILSDTGFVGLALFLLFLSVALRPLGLRRLRADPVLLTLAALFFSRLTATMFGADLSNQQPLFVFVGLLALRPPAESEAVDAPAYRAPSAGASQSPGLGRRESAAT
jgi:O-antigen ligase